MTTYTEGFKARLVQRMAGPEGISVSELSDETGVSRAALYRWQHAASNLDGMNRGKRAQGGHQSNKKWTPEKKFRVLIEASQFSDQELGTYLRSEGVHDATLLQWRDAATAALAATSKRRSTKKSPDAKKVVLLERELLRKDTALAEMAALITLKKKVLAIWGDEDGDMGMKNAT